MERIEKTVFISYRRTDVYAALAVYQYLTSKGYDVFFDYTSIHAGDFEQIIVSNINARAHFVLILTPTALDRCNEPGDWLRREVEISIDQKRNIVPLFFNGFKFGTPSVSEKLTGKLGNLSRYNGINVHEDYFHAAMERLSREFLSIPLDTILHPVSADVRKIVKKEQVAADKALRVDTKKVKPKPMPEKMATKQSKPVTENQKIEGKSEISAPAIRKTNKQVESILGGHEIYTFGEIEFLKVPEGKFLMGSATEDYQALPDERSQHIVTIPYDYWIARYPVTNEQYARFMNTKGSKHPVDGWENIHNHPVTLISREDALAYGSWLTSILKGKLPNGLLFRLATEAEWEKAARGTDGRIYPWGNVWDNGNCNNVENGPITTTPVGKFSPQGDSPFGCADMSGNVWELTHSFYKKYPYNVKDGREREKTGLLSVFESPLSVVRGGSFYSRGNGTLLSGGGTARCAFRRGENPGGRAMVQGFRLAVSVPLI